MGFSRTLVCITMAWASLSHALTYQLLSTLAATNVSEPSAAEAMCHNLVRTHSNVSRQAFAMAGSSTAPDPPGQGCYFFCQVGKNTGVVPNVMSEIPWNGMCFSGNNVVVNRFGPWVKACPRVGWKSVRGTYAAASSWADPKAEAIVSTYYLLLRPMRHELRDAGRAEGFAKLKGTWLGAYFMAGFHLMDFALLPVQCPSTDMVEVTSS